MSDGSPCFCDPFLQKSEFGLWTEVRQTVVCRDVSPSFVDRRPELVSYLHMYTYCDTTMKENAKIDGMR